MGPLHKLIHKLSITTTLGGKAETEEDSTMCGESEVALGGTSR